MKYNNKEAFYEAITVVCLVIAMLCFISKSCAQTDKVDTPTIRGIFHNRSGEQGTFIVDVLINNVLEITEIIDDKKRSWREPIQIKIAGAQSLYIYTEFGKYTLNFCPNSTYKICEMIVSPIEGDTLYYTKW